MQTVKKTVFVLKHRACNQKTFNPWGGFLELGHFDKHFVKTQKKGPQGKNFGLFVLDTVGNYLSNKMFNPKMDAIRPFFQS